MPTIERRLVAVLVIAYVLLALAFSLASPIFEAPDEIEHFRYIRTIAQTGALPDPAGQQRGQYHQPPLYYLLHVPLLVLMDDTGFEQIDGDKNPFYGFRFDIPGGDNKNEYLHTRAESFPFTSPIARTVHLLRLLSIAMGIGTIFACYRIFCLLWNNTALRLMAVGFLCFFPQFVYVSGHLNNDNLMTLLATLILWWLLKHHGKSITWRQAAILGVLGGAAALTKSSAIFLALPGLAALAMNRGWWRQLPLIAVSAFIVGGWYYVRNLLLYNDLTLLAAWQQTWSFDVVNHGRFALDVALQNFPYVYFTFPARFGSGAVTLGDFFTVFNGVALVTVAGLMIRLVQIIRQRPAIQQGLIVTAFGTAWLVSAFYLSGIAWSGNQGRYLLPGIAAWGAVVVYGITAFVPRRVLPFAAFAGISAWFAIALITFFAFFLPAYHLERVPDTILNPVNIRYGDVIELTGVSQTTLTAAPGEVTSITLYWKALAETDDSLNVFIHSLDSDMVRRDSLPGAGKLLSTDWQPGDTWAETYLIPVPPDAEKQRVYPLLIGLYESETQTQIPAFNARGEQITPAPVRLVIHGDPGDQPEIAYRFGDVIGLAVPEIRIETDSAEVCLTWAALAGIPQDYTVFVHLLDENSGFVAQSDAQPHNNSYPTGVWLPGETIYDCILFDTGGKAVDRIAIGVYLPQDFSRLPVTDAAGNALPDSQLVLNADH